MLVQKIIRHGNSLAVVIPAKACQALAVKRGDMVVLRIPTEKVLFLDFAARLTWPKKVKELYLKTHHGKRHYQRKKTASRPHRRP